MSKVAVQVIMAFLFSLSLSCQVGRNKEVVPKTEDPFSFKENLDFLEEFVDVDVLMAPNGSGLVACVGALQGRVMTSSVSGLKSESIGWINYDLFRSGDTLPHINPFGGEERFWLGPEGGQYSIFFKADDPFDLAHWQTPHLIDLTSFERTARSRRSVTYAQRGQLENYQGSTFQLHIDRTIEMLDMYTVLDELGINPGHLESVGYRSINTLTNSGVTPWTKETGLLSIWLLGMFKPSDETTIVIPYLPGEEENLGSVVNDEYFGRVSPERLKISNAYIFFKGDGKMRGKIGVNPLRAKNILGAYSATSQLLTVVKYVKSDSTSDYVNSLWKIQDNPFAGDVINAYNDGPPSPGTKPLGPFYELETSSPALALKPGEKATHLQETMHFAGDERFLTQITEQWFGLALTEIEGAFTEH